MSSDLVSSDESNSGTCSETTNNTEAKFVVSEPSNSFVIVVIEPVVVSAQLSECGDSISENNLLGSSEDQEFSVWLKT